MVPCSEPINNFMARIRVMKLTQQNFYGHKGGGRCRGLPITPRSAMSATRNVGQVIESFLCHCWGAIVMEPQDADISGR